MKTLSLKTNRSRQARRIDPDRAERAVLAQQALARMRVKRAAENGSETPSEREKTVEQLTPSR